MFRLEAHRHSCHPQPDRSTEAECQEISLFNWSVAAELLAAEKGSSADGGDMGIGPGIVRRGTLSELIRDVMRQPRDRRDLYSIIIPGHAHITTAQIERLHSRSDFPD